MLYAGASPGEDAAEDREARRPREGPYTREFRDVVFEGLVFDDNSCHHKYIVANQIDSFGNTCYCRPREGDIT